MSERRILALKGGFVIRIGRIDEYPIVQIQVVALRFFFINHNPLFFTGDPMHSVPAVCPQERQAEVENCVPKLIDRASDSPVRERVLHILSSDEIHRHNRDAYPQKNFERNNYGCEADANLVYAPIRIVDGV